MVDLWFYQSATPRCPVSARRAARADQEGPPPHGQGRDRQRLAGGEVRHGEGLPLHPLGRRRRTGHHRRPLHSRPAQRRTETVGTARREGCVHQPRGDPHLQRLLRLRDPRRRKAGAAAAAVRGDDPRPRRPGLDEGLERRRGRGDLRVAGRFDLRHSPQRPPPALQRLRTEAGPLRLLDEHARRHEPLRRRRLRLRHPARLPGAVQRRTRLLLPPRASRRACCWRPTSSPTRSACR